MPKSLVARKRVMQHAARDPAMIAAAAAAAAAATTSPSSHLDQIFQDQRQQAHRRVK